jgi:hypothetical protein
LFLVLSLSFLSLFSLGILHVIINY